VAVGFDEDVAWVAVGLEEAVEQQHATVRLCHSLQQPPRRHRPHRRRQRLAPLLPKRVT